MAVVRRAAATRYAALRRGRVACCAVAFGVSMVLLPHTGGLQLSAFLPLLAAHESPEVASALGRRSALAAVAPALVTASTLAPPSQAAETETKWKRLRPIQFIAALGSPDASSGSGAETWGLWKKDPGPRGVDLDRIEGVKKRGGVAPAGWKFDDADWYVEEHGLIMEKPTGGDGGSGEQIKPGKYLVTGDRKVTTTLTVSPPDEKGAMKWQLGEGQLYDVTHLPCRTGRYTGPACTPANARQADFPVTPGGLMPPVEGCNKLDYAVLFVIGVAA